MKINFDTYYKFYLQNKDKIFMSPEETYPINDTNIENWIQAISRSETMCSETEKENCFLR